jgi:electron-transferring-flavoprotein dehydrogenase
MSDTNTESQPNIPRQSMDVDIVCAGFGPAMGGFLTTLSRAMVDENGMPVLHSKVMPGMPPQVLCYERADDIGFGVSGVVTSARAIRASFPDLDTTQIPMAHPVTSEQVLYLLDPIGASRRSVLLKAADAVIRALSWMLPYKDHAFRLPYIPPFLCKHDGLIFSIGQFNQWVGSQLMASGTVQVWPGMPVNEPLIEDNKVTGVRLVDQGVDRTGKPDAGYMPGMDVHAALTVVGDGPVGPVGQSLDEHFGLPDGNHQRDWAVGMKVVVDLPEHCELKEGTVLHTLGYPEPEIFGFMYVHPDRVASMGIFVPSWFDCPVRTAYRYLQHWMKHPSLWKHLEGGTLRSWGAKSLQESGRRGEPHLTGDGYARIGEGSGSTNVLTNSGVDEAWQSGTLLAEGVIELLKKDEPFSKENLDKAYTKRRRESNLDAESKIAQKARDGFQKGFITGLIGTGLTGITGGKLNLGCTPKRPHERIPSVEEYYKGKISKDEIDKIRKETVAAGVPMHEALMERCGWPTIEYDGKLLISQQDALLLGGKVQAAPGFADHVLFLDTTLCESCNAKVCIEACSGQAISPGEDDGVPQFDREKCIHCGACMWNCSKQRKNDPEKANVEFRAGSGGLHSAEN